MTKVNTSKITTKYGEFEGFGFKNNYGENHCFFDKKTNRFVICIKPGKGDEACFTYSIDGFRALFTMIGFELNKENNLPSAEEMIKIAGGE